MNLAVYLDYATIPSLNYLLDFAQYKDDQQTIRLFGLARFNIPQSIIDQYPAGVIQFFKIENHDQSQLNNQFRHIVEKSEQLIDVCFHINLFHSWAMLYPLLSIYRYYRHKFRRVSLKLYDDGTQGLLNLQKLIDDNHNLNQLIEEDRHNLVQLMSKNDGHIYSIHKEIAYYLWNNVFPTTYYFLSDKLLKHEKLALLVEEIKCYQLMDLSQFARLDEPTKQFLLQLLDINSSVEKIARAFFNQYNTFLFIGTTFFNVSDSVETLFSMHQKALNAYLHPQGKCYIGQDYYLCIKGHPNSPEINQMLKTHYPNALHIPAYIPLEALYYLGCKPTKMGGFISTSHLNVDRDCLTDIIFITKSDEQARKENRILTTQYELAQTVCKLNLIESQHIHFLFEL